MRARLFGGAVVALAFGAAAFAQQSRQQETPESLLPPGFGEQPAPSPTPTSTAAPGTSQTTGVTTAPIGPLPPLEPLPLPSDTPSGMPTPLDASQLALYEMPAFARRSLDTVGAATPREGALSADAFGGANGRYLEILMRRLSAPLPSRWLSITLRRLLVAQLDTPAGVNGADFAAERAWLLLRMGESVAARAVVQGVDTDNVTPKLRDVWMQASLATADPAGLCTLADVPSVRASSASWQVAQPMCQALTGTKTQAAVADLRRRRVATGIDLQLAQKVIGAGYDARQSITIEWGPVTQLTAWRWGLATATGVEIPDALYATVGPQVTAWRALSPAVAIGDRIAPAQAAAAMGVLSNAALVDLFSSLSDGDSSDVASAASAIGDDLRAAYSGATLADRMTGLKQLWDGGASPSERYARLILTARAAGRIPVADNVEEADRLVASMLSAGLDRTALRWRGHVSEGGDGAAMLSLVDPDAGGRLGYAAVTNYARQGNAELKRRMYFAALAGLGRLSAEDVQRGAEALDVQIGASNPWTRAIDQAAQNGEAGTVVLVAAIGMQTSDWNGVPPAALYRIVAALRAVGLDGEARMIAVEAITRL